jgi:PKD repeat protein
MMKTIKSFFLVLLPFCMISQKNTSLQSLSGNIKLSIIASWITDSTEISFQPGATSSFDSGMDILKGVPSNTTDPIISTVSGAQDLYMNALACSQNIVDIPVRVKVGITGKYILQMDSNAILYSGSCVMLEDLALSYFQDLKSNSSYSFTIEDTTDAPRFLLHIGKAPDKNALSPCFNSNNGMAIMSSYSTGNWDCTWMDSLGNIIVTNTNIVGADTLKNLSPGKYPLMINGNSGYCYSSFYDTIVVDPAIPLSVSALITHVTCPGSNTGILNASTVSGGQAPYSYSWSNSCTNPIIQNLAPGNYTLILSDANGCTDTASYAVQQLSNLAVSFIMSADTLTMANPTVTFTNQTTGQTTISWDFGDGSPFSNAYSPNHTFSSAGTFTIELVASDAFCVLTKQEVLVVLNPTGILSAGINQGLNIYSYDGKAVVKFDLETEKNALISVYGLDGKFITSKRTSARVNSEELQLGDAKGIYLVEVEIDNTRTTKKLIN